MPTVHYEDPREPNGVASIKASYVNKENGEYKITHYPDAPDHEKEDPTCNYMEATKRVPAERVIEVDEGMY